MVLQVEGSSGGLAVKGKLMPEASVAEQVEDVVEVVKREGGSGAADEEAPSTEGGKEAAAAEGAEAEAEAAADASNGEEAAAAGAAANGTAKANNNTNGGKPLSNNNSSQRGPPFQPYAGIPSFTQLKATNLTDWPPGRGLTFIRPCPSGTASLEKLAVLQSCPQILTYIQGFSGADWIDATFSPQPCVRITASTQIPGGAAAAEAILRLSDEMVLQWLHRFDPGMPIWAMFVAPAMLSGLLVGKLAVNLKAVEASSGARVWAAPRDTLAQFVSFFICSSNHDSTRAAYAMLEARALTHMDALGTQQQQAHDGSGGYGHVQANASFAGSGAPPTPPAPQPASPVGFVKHPSSSSSAANAAGGNEEPINTANNNAASASTGGKKKKKKKNKGASAAAAATAAAAVTSPAAAAAETADPAADPATAAAAPPAKSISSSNATDSDNDNASTDTEPSTQPISRTASDSPAPGGTTASSQQEQEQEQQEQQQAAGVSSPDASGKGKEEAGKDGAALSPAKKQEAGGEA